MAYSQADLEQLQANIAKGLQSAMLNGEMVTFRSLAEMRQTERMIMDALASAGGTPPARRMHTPTTSTGWR